MPNVGSDMHPVWNPEVFFNAMVVNGLTWQYLDVAPERYRFRAQRHRLPILESLSLKYVDPSTTTTLEIPFFLIGPDQNMLPNVVRIKTGFATPDDYYYRS